jgi:CAAX protease family protein
VLLWMFAGMVPYRVLMTWVYRHTRSVLLAILMHAAYTGGQVLLEPGGTGQPQDLLWWGLLGLALGAAVGLVVLADRAHFLWPVPLQ